ncbi:MAG: hypothetical protein GY711_31165 [bacterium]|nr:hypothetical protein [bacterium]
MPKKLSITALKDMEGGVEIHLAGFVLQKAELVVKSGRMAGSRMCRFRLEDLHGAINVTVFPRPYEELKDLIENGNVILCRGKIEDSGEEPALLLDEALPLSEALRRFQGGVQVSLSREDQMLLPDLVQVAQRHNGKCPLFLQTSGSDGVSRRVRAGKGYGVAISEELATEMTELVGGTRVGLVRV